MRVIDFRARPNTERYMSMYPPDYGSFDRVPGHSRPDPVPLERYIESLDANDIDVGVFVGRQTVEDGEVVRGISNDYVAECVERYPDRIVGFAGIDPTTDIQWNLEEIDRSITDLGLSGISIYPTTESEPTDRLYHHRRAYPIYARAVELDVPISVTVGPNIGEVGKSHDPHPIATIANDFPDLTIVCAHASWPTPTAFVNLAYKLENVYLDGSIYQFFPGAEPFLEAAKGLIADKVLWASAFPFGPLSDVRRLEEYDFSEEVLEKIRYANAARVLGLG